MAGSGNWIYLETEDGIEMSKTTNRELKILFLFLSIFVTHERSEDCKMIAGISDFVAYNVCRNFNIYR